ncbi:MAG: HAMP domain-containing histidine kinase [Deltaproteobacteria bacterium]|nr:HAMP domain-containing histidine kinase [Nannocystaceae bacterium]
MLEKFIVTHRNAIIEIARTRVALRMSPKPSDEELVNGIPRFLDQLGNALRLAKTTDAVDHRAIQESAAMHGRELLEMGLTIAQVVHDYGDVCQAVTTLVAERQVKMDASEFRTLNLCLDDAIAGAVTEFARLREQALAVDGNERLGQLAHQLRGLLNTATLAFSSVQSGRVATAGSTGMLLSRCLLGLRDLVDLSLAEVRLDAGIGQREQIRVADLLEEIEIGALMYAKDRGVQFSVELVDRDVKLDGDRQALASALANLLQNALKFTPPEGRVLLRARVTDDRVAFDVLDACGGLPARAAEALFDPSAQVDVGGGGTGRGLAICRKAALAHNGEVSVRDVPGKGCVFTFELPRVFVQAPPEIEASDPQKPNEP